MNPLNPEEQAIFNAFEQGQLKRIEQPSHEVLIQAAKTTFKKDKRVNIRMSGIDLQRIQERASIEGIPYQTLMSSVLHKFVNGRFTER